MNDQAPFSARRAAMAATYRTFYSKPLQVSSASGCVITDVNGRKYLDAYNNVPVIGHSNRDVREAVNRELGRANVHTRYLDAAVVDYARRLVDMFPQHLASVAFTCSGSEANDLALRIASDQTGRDGVIVTRNAYHGTTSATSAISPSLIGNVPEHVEAVELPEWDDAEFDVALAGAIRAASIRLGRRGHPAGAFVLDSTMTSDGIANPLPLPATAAAVKEAGALYIADEVQAGFGRTGAPWGFLQLEVDPDLVTVGKPMANGLPLAAVMSRSELFDGFGSRQRYFNTFAGTAVPISAAAVVLSRLESGELSTCASEAGELLEQLLREIVSSSPVDVTIRRSGMMVGIDFLAGDRSRREAGLIAATMVENLYAQGILVSTTGRGGVVLKVRPPLIITEEQIRLLSSGFDAALHQALEEVH